MTDILRSWKDIARHMGTSVRTAQRWERELRLPVRRVDAKRGAVVFAYCAELDNWLQGRSSGQVALVQDSFFRTVFMNSQFPSLVLDDLPRILAANVAADDLLRATSKPLLGEDLEWVLSANGLRGARLQWAGFLQSGACSGRANLRLGDGTMAGVEFIVKRFLPGLHVLSVLSLRKPWPEGQLCCRPVAPDFAFKVRGGGRVGPKAGRRAVSGGRC